MSSPNLVYFDLETQKSAAEVGGWHNKRAMKVALGVTYSTQRGTYEIYREDDVYALLQELQRADRVIGYNVIDFDFEVLAPYAVFDLSQVPVLDLMRDVEKNIGMRVGLDAISEQTLGCGKTADGMEADQLSEQILAALVDEHGRKQEDGSARAWLRKRRKGPLA